MAVVKLENPPLFVRADEELSSVAPKFSKRDLDSIRITSEHYNIFGDLDGAGGTRYSLRLPKCGLEISECVTGEFQNYHGGYIEMINRYVKENPTAEATKWINANARDLNIAKHYWAAVELREIAESYLVKANLNILDAKSFAGGKWGLTDEEKKLALTEFGYDPEKSWDY
jgi:hypothetical protein